MKQKQSLQPNLPFLRVQLRISIQKLPQVPKYIIYTYNTQEKTCIQITIRSLPQIIHLFMTLTHKYGGFVIPVLFLDSNAQAQPAIPMIRQYLNDLLQSPHCHKDPLLLDFILRQSVEFPHVDKFQKVLSDAAIFSRRYLNDFFTRKEQSDNKTEWIQLSNIYQSLLQFKQRFKQLRELANDWQKQQEMVQEIVQILHQVGGELGLGVQTIDFVSGKYRRALEKLWKLILQSEEAYARWQVQNQTVRELRCNIYKGLHQDSAAQKLQSSKLQSWSKSILIDLKQVINQGQQLLDSLSQHLYVAKRQQMQMNSWNPSLQKPSQLN